MFLAFVRRYLRFRNGKILDFEFCRDGLSRIQIRLTAREEIRDLLNPFLCPMNYKRRDLFRSTAILTCSTLLLVSSHAAMAVPDFEKEVAPVLEQTCLSCHNAEEEKGDLDLSTREATFAFEGGIVPRDPDGSLLVEVVSGPDPDMPKKAGPLTDKQISILSSWIAAGAEWPEGRTLVHNPKRDLDWWSLLPISKPEMKGMDGHSHPVDSFIDSKLEEKGLVPVPEADPATLIRRVTYDLTGLPPTPEEVDAFLAHPDWEAAVDRLLESPAFGEKFGQHWLDVARYAETHGYDKDKPRNNAWPYRDYVINSFNEDKPFSRFVQEQVAGDALFPGDPDGIVALGFLAAGPWDFIGHWEVGEAKLDGRIAKHLDRDEMVSTVFNVFQSNDRSMRPVPPPQIRPHPDGGLLPAARRLRRVGPVRPGLRRAPAR